MNASPESGLDRLKRWNPATPLSPQGLTLYLHPRPLGGYDYFTLATGGLAAAIAPLVNAGVTDADLLAIAALPGAGWLKRISDGNWALSALTAADIGGLGSAASHGASDFAAASHGHANATTSAAGFMAAADKSKLDGIAAGANLYVHPAGDGNLHVPATGTTHNGMFLMAGPAAGSLTWSVAPVASVAGKTGAVVLNAADVGLGNVNNTADANKPISTAQATALANRLRVDAGQGLSSLQQQTGRNNLGLGSAATASTGAFAAANHSHSNATTAAAGFMSAADKSKLDSLTPGGYTPPSGDGYLYVPATGTTHNGMFLMAGATAGAISWQNVPVSSVSGKTGAVTLVKSDVGLGNVDNTADANKPISAATATALAGKASTTHTHANATTSVPGFMSDTDKSKLDGIAAGAQINTVTSVNTQVGAVVISKADVGLGNVDNTADANKPLSGCKRWQIQLHLAVVKELILLKIA